jgi:frataxin-like iron-binding protein CyaY
MADAWMAYRLRWKRRRLLWRAFRKRRQLRCVVDRTAAIAPGDILLFATVRNEAERLPHFLAHYRALGVRHFLIVDNDSTDGSDRILTDQTDVSLWHSAHSYKGSRFGMDWITWLMARHGHGYWCVVADADELLIYPYWETRPLQALTGWLESQGRTAFGAMMLDLYPQGPLGQAPFKDGDDPLATLHWFDSGNYIMCRQEPLRNLWIQGGVRARSFFAVEPRRAPTLGKLPLVRWNRRYAWVSSTHSALPRRLNQNYATDGAEGPSGILLHTKFLNTIVAKSAQERERGEHFGNSVLYDRYYAALQERPDLWSACSSRYQGWRHLEALGLMSRGGWV